MAINLSTLSATQLEALKKNNPELYQANIGSLSTKPTTSSGGSMTLPVTGSGNISGGTITLTPEQQARVVQNNPTLASNLGINAPSGYTATPTAEKSLADATKEALPEAESKSSLVDFADALNKATSLARQRRQASEMGVLEDFGFKPGQVSASTMGQILNLLQTKTDTSYGALENAALDAYKAETERKATDAANKQQLALSLLTKGVDQTTIQGLLNAPDFNSALSMAAGALKATNQYKDVRSAEVDGKLTFFGVTEDGQVEQIATFGTGAGGSSGGFTLSEGQTRYDAAGNPIASVVDTSPEPISGPAAVTWANELISLNKDAGYNELFLGMKANTNLSDGEVARILSDAGYVEKETKLTDTQMSSIAIAYVKEVGVEEAKKIIESGTIIVNDETITLSAAQKTALISEIDKQYPEGKRTFLQSVLPGGK